MNDWNRVLGEDLRVEVIMVAAPTTAPPSLSEAACRLLDGLPLLEEGGGEDGLSRDCQRLEQKLDLIIDLLGAQLSERLPPPEPLTLSAKGLVLPARFRPECGACIALYPSARLPQPLVLELRDWHCAGDACGARWASEDARLRDALGRWVFRLHRRALARERAASRVRAADH